MSYQGNNKDTGGFLQRFKTRLLRRSSLTTLSLLGVLTIILLIWKVPQWQATDIHDPKDRATIENAARGTFVQALGGLFFLVTAYFSFQNLKVTQENLKVTQQNLVATQEKQVTERFAKAIEQLGNENIHVRLGAIYALERIAKDSDKDYLQVMEILTAYVREISPYPPREQKADNTPFWAIALQNNNDPPIPDSLKDIPPIATDIQAVLTVIARRTKSLDQGEENPLDLSRSNLKGANLKGAVLGGANLERANLERANLERANLERANLERANLSDADLRRANLTKAKMYRVNLGAADLGAAILTEANLTQANLIEADLSRANLLGADLSRANLMNAKCTDDSTSQQTCKKFSKYYPCPTIFPKDFDPKKAGMKLVK